MTHDCPLCEYQSGSDLGLKQHLSQSHKDKNNPNKSQTDCKNCGSDFWILNSYLEMGKGTFCSKECKHEFGRVYCVCENCEEEFTIDKNAYNRREGNGTFCSMECKSDYKSVDKNCEICGEGMHVKKSCVENGGGKYCSKTCYYKSEISDTAGVRKTSEYKQWRNDVKSRDGCCVDCGNKEGLHAHHIVPISEDKSMATDLDNGETLCVKCHADEHPEIAHLIIESFNTDSDQ